MTHKERIKALKGGSSQNGKYVLYWMQASQRAEWNHALEFAIQEANNAKLPLLVCFGITDKYPDANIRHYRFMLEGLKQTAVKLKERNINFVIRKKSPEKLAVELSKNAALTIFDRAYMPIQRKWREYAAAIIKTPIIQVESDIVVPVESASNKEEYAAYTIREKINKARNYFLQPLKSKELKIKTRLDVESLDISNTEQILNNLDLDKSVPTCEKYYRGGADEAQKRLKLFISDKLTGYSEKRNDPGLDLQSGLSPYIHFGQISPLEAAIEVKKHNSPDANAFLEELIVRRELAINFANYNDACQDYSSLPHWAKATLEEHSNDPREYIYSIEELENAITHDLYWNAAQKEMVTTGKMHGYLRMYWGKMILQWSRTPQEAFRRALYLNDKYELDGRDPNSCTGVSWCFGKHDRPWPSHPVTGKVRLMNQNGLKRKVSSRWKDMITSAGRS